MAYPFPSHLLKSLLGFVFLAPNLSLFPIPSKTLSLRQSRHRQSCTDDLSDADAKIEEGLFLSITWNASQAVRVVGKVLAIHGYDRGTKRFVIEPVQEAQHAA